MALRAFFAREYDIDLTDAHIELGRSDFRWRQKQLYLQFDVFQSREVAGAGGARLHMIEMTWGLDDLKDVHHLLKDASTKGLLVLKKAIEAHAKTKDRDDKDDHSPTEIGVDAEDVVTLA